MKRRYKPRRCPCYRTDEERVEAIRAAAKAWKERHKNKVIEQQAEYYLRNRIKILEGKKAYYANNRQDILQKAKCRERVLPRFSKDEMKELLSTVEKLLGSRGKK